MEKLMSHGTAVNSAVDDINITNLHDPQGRYFDGVVIIDVARAEDFSPRVRPNMNHLVINPNVAIPAGLNGRGMRYWSAYRASTLTDALYIVVSEESSAISLFHRGTMQQHLQMDAFESQLRRASGDLLRTLVGSTNVLS